MMRLANLYLEQADVARLQSNLPRAIECFTKAIDVYKKLAEEDRSCWSLVADTIEKVGATYKAAGELDKAAEAFADAATLRQAILKSRVEDE